VFCCARKQRFQTTAFLVARQVLTNAPFVLLLLLLLLLLQPRCARTAALACEAAQHHSL
jgi:hypothetical protein